MKVSEIQGIDVLLKKLGHSISDIRTRALESILSKLEHQLLVESDLVQERQLFIHLLEWFNFSEVPAQDKVLKLLERLTKHSAACDLLSSIGAIPFLSSLRADISDNDRPQLDVILDRLFHLTTNQVAESRKRCVYGQAQNKTKVSQFESYSSAEVKYGYFNSDTANMTVNSSIPPVARDIAPLQQAISSNTGRGGTQHPSCLRFAGFPWHTLTKVDIMVMRQTGDSLCSLDNAEVLTGCSHLLNVMFRDFPAEIFLQRPATVKSLITLLSSRPSSKLMADTLRCIRTLSRALIARVRFFEDPAMYYTRRGMPFHSSGGIGSSVAPSSASSSSAGAASSSYGRHSGEGKPQRTGGDGRDAMSSSSTSSPLSVRHHHNHHHQASSSTADDDFENGDDIGGLRALEMRPSHFALTGIRTCAPALKSDCAKLVFSLLQTLWPLVELLEKTLAPAEELWRDRSILAQQLQALTVNSLQSLAEALLHHHQLACDSSDPDEWSAPVNGEEPVVKRVHRVVYQALVKLVVKFLPLVVPLEQSSIEIRGEVVKSLLLMSCDPCTLTPDQQQLVARYLLLGDRCWHDAHQKALRVAAALVNLRRFVDVEVEGFATGLLDGGGQEYRCSETAVRVAQLMESTVEGLPHHCYDGEEGLFRDVKALVVAVSAIFDGNRPGRTDERSSKVELCGKRLLLALTAATQRPETRACAYRECAAIAGDALSDHLAPDSQRVAPDRCRFLLDADILARFARSRDPHARRCLALLLRSRPFMRADAWWQLRHVMRHVTALVQPHDELGQGPLLNYLSGGRDDDDDDDGEFIEACVRGLMLKDRDKRRQWARRLAAICPVAGESSLIDLFVVESPLSLADEDNQPPVTTGEDSIGELVSVLRDEGVESSVRVAALRQLATVLNHGGARSFAASGGVELIRKEMERSAPPRDQLTEAEKPALVACASVLKIVSRDDEVARARMSRSRRLYSLLVRLAHLARRHSSPALLHHSTQLAGLLVFARLTSQSLSAYHVPFTTAHVTEQAEAGCEEPLRGPYALLLARATGRQDDDDDATLFSAAERREDAWRHLAEALRDAPSHERADHVISLMRMVMMGDDVRAMTRLPLLRTTLDHFLQVSPTCYEDEALLAGITALVDEALARCDPRTDGADFVAWAINSCVLRSPRRSAPLSGQAQAVNPMLDALSHQHQHNASSAVSDTIGCLPGRGGAGIRLSPPVCGARSRLCERILDLFARISRILHAHPAVVEAEAARRCVARLWRVALMRLGLNNTLRAYHLPSMEVALATLVHVTANRLSTAPGGDHDEAEEDEDERDLLKTMLRALLEIVSAFDFGGGSLFYMGKGVSRCATHSILHIARHLAANRNHSDTEWPRMLEKAPPAGGVREPRLSSTQRSGEGVGGGDSGLYWIVPLWSARDSRTRAASLSIAALVARCRYGALSLARSFRHIHGGVWNMALAIFLDHSECSLVREQACDLLNNLIAHKFDQHAPVDESELYQIYEGPVVQEDEYSRPIRGVEALLSLIQHFNLLTHATLMVNSFHHHSTVASPALLQHISSSGGGGSDLLRHRDDVANSSAHTISTIPSQGSNPEEEKAQTSAAKSQNYNDEIGREKRVPYSIDGDMVLDSWRSLTTPSLMAATCNLLATCVHKSPATLSLQLLHSNLLYYITNLINTPRLQQLVDKLSEATPTDGIGEMRKRRSMLLVDLLRLHHSIVRLVAVCVRHQPKLTRPLISMKDNYVDKIASLFALRLSDKSDSKVRELVGGIEQLSLELLSSLMRYCFAPPNNHHDDEDDDVRHHLDDVTVVFHRNWDVMFEGVKRNLSCEEKHERLLAAISFVASFFKLEHERFTNSSTPDQHQLAWLTDKETGEAQVKVISLTLVKRFEQLITSPSATISGEVHLRMMATCQALRNLITCSHHAKRAAVAVGLLESLLPILERLNSKLVLRLTASLTRNQRGNHANHHHNNTTASHTVTSSSLLAASTILVNGGCGKLSTTNAAEDSAVSAQPLLEAIQLLTNLIHADVDLKRQACERGLGLMIYKLWKTSIISPRLRTALTKLIINYTANCEKAASSLCAVMNSGSQHPTLMSHLVTTAKHHHNENLVGCGGGKPTLATPPPPSLVFAALINCAASSECRAVVWKARLVEQCLGEAASRAQHGKRSRRLHHQHQLNHWLRLVLALTPHTDAQLNIIKIPDIFEILLELYSSNQCSTPDNRFHIIRIVRNLSFHAPSKARMSSLKPVVSLLVSCLEKEEKGIRVIAASALLSLLYNNQKVKVHLKGAGMVKSIETSIARLTLKEDEGRMGCDDRHFRSTLHNIIDNII